MNSDDTKSRLAVILINYNNEDYTITCLDSLENQTLDEFRTIVVDNGSDPSSLEQIQSKHPWPEYVELEENEGFTGGNNAGINRVRSDVDWILLLNNDTEIEPDFLATLLSRANETNPDTGIVGPNIHTFETKEVWASGGKIDELTSETSHNLKERSEPEYVDYVPGCAILIRNEVFDDIGLLDEDFFIYYEETEFCVRARNHGWRCIQIPVSGVYHKDSVEYEASTFREYYYARNRLLFAKKVNSLPKFVFFLLWYIPRWMILQPARHFNNRDYKMANATLRGVLDAFLWNTGRGHEKI